MHYFAFVPSIIYGRMNIILLKEQFLRVLLENYFLQYKIKLY